MSHGSNTYSQFLDDDDDDEITSIIEDYMKHNKPECSQDKQHLDHGVVSTDHIPERSVGAYLELKVKFTFNSRSSDPDCLTEINTQF